MIPPAPRDLRELRRRLTPRDLAIAASVDQYRLLTTRHVQRLHFDTGHASASAAARACTRALLRLRDLGILRPLERRIGGVRAGSAGFVWYIGPTGDRLVHHLQHLQLVEPIQPMQLHPGATDAAEAGMPHHRRRRNYQEPSRHFVEHTLAVAELAVTAIEATRTTGMTQTASRNTTSGSAYEMLALEAEPACWQRGLSPSGASQWLKPDLRLVTATTTDEYHWFVEVDLATEHIPVIIRQCLAYQDYRATGLYEAAHGLFPAILWVVPTQARKAALQAALSGTAALDSALFQVCTGDQFRSRVFRPPDPTDSETAWQNGQEG